MEFKVKTFDELTKKELYEILKARAEIFTVEKKMNCQDLDDLDFDCKHMYLEDDGEIVAYLRAFKKTETDVKISRILTLKHGKGTGRKLIENCIDEIKKSYLAEKIVLNAQKDAVGFYLKMGFKVVSDEFVEAGVPHFAMERGI